jgi:3-hydroxyisobutyrate dehydrogenase-like beta-hydroxyacid dehydrogenase
MGRSLVERLLQIIPEVRVFDVRADAMAEAVSAGAIATDSVAGLASAVEVMITALPNPEASLAVAKEARRGQALEIFLETSTVGVQCIAEMSGILDRIALVDSPLSGGPRGILAGTASAFLAGPPEVRSRIAPWFDGLIGTAIVVGDTPGAAQTVKLVNNAISLSGLAIACEAIAVGVAAGVEAEILLEGINASSGRNSATSSKIPISVLTRRFDFGGPISLAEKDLELYCNLASASGLAQSLLECPLEAFREAIQTLGGRADYTEIARLYEAAVDIEITDRNAAPPSGLGRWRSEILD